MFSRFTHSRAVTDSLSEANSDVNVDILSEVMIDVDVEMLPDVMLRVGTDILFDVMIDFGVDMFSDDTEIIVIATPAIALGFVEVVPCAVDVLADLITDFVLAINVAMLDDENVIGLAVTMAPLELTLSTS